jgi:cAMP-binding proteins - catabolite gene activator and regulatory subunit of cAMP-dependent protein kinases
VNPTSIEVALERSESIQHFKAGQTLFREGEEPEGVLLLHSGEVDLLFCDRHGEPKPLRIAQPGQILGLSCVVAHRRYDCTAAARTACMAGFVDRDEFLRMLDGSSDAWFGLLRMLSIDVNAAYDDMRLLAAR